MLTSLFNNQEEIVILLNLKLKKMLFLYITIVLFLFLVVLLNKFIFLETILNLKLNNNNKFKKLHLYLKKLNKNLRKSKFDINRLKYYNYFKIIP